jgi:LmbE family N-acetylglucosaminyl deacetylase
MNILVFFAHPDDETVFTGGTLALLGCQGARVHYLCATRGEGGEAGEPPLCSLEELGDVRAGELACAVEQLGGHDLTFLDYVDPRVGADNQLYPYTPDVDLLTRQVAGHVRRVGADVLISHGSNGEYGHPAHVLTHQAARAAVESLDGGDAPLFYSFSAIFPNHPRPRIANPDDEAHLILDVSPVLAQKTQAALCHRTQHALFVRGPSKDAGRQLSVPEVIRRLESLHRHLPACDGKPVDELSLLLQAYAVGKG